MNPGTGAIRLFPMLRDVLERGIRRLDGHAPTSDAVGDINCPWRQTHEEHGVTPGGVLTYGDRQREWDTIAFGRSHLVVPDGGPAVFDVERDTIYDLASITKTIATGGALMRLGVDPNQKIRSIVPELQVPGSDQITLAHLLGHTSGFPAHLEFFRRLLAGERPAGSARDSLLAMVTSTKLVAAPGEREIYSDLGYITLGFAIERLTGKRLDDAVKELVTEPLGMADTFFVDLTGESRPVRPLHRIAPTEVCPYRRLVHGEVHDGNAHAGGGICGHAGLFATAGDVARFARAMLQVLDGQPVAGFQPDVVRYFTRTQSGPDARHTLGWDRPSPPPVVTHIGDRWPRQSIGHLGFTGGSMWLDPAGGRYAILLTNRVHPTRVPQGIKEFRRAAMDAVTRAFERDDRALG